MNLEPLVMPLRLDNNQYIQQVRESTAALQMLNKAVNLTSLASATKEFENQYKALNKMEGALRKVAEVWRDVAANQQKVAKGLAPGLFAGMPGFTPRGMPATGAFARPAAPEFGREAAMRRQRLRQEHEDRQARAAQAARDRRGREIIGRVNYHLKKDAMRNLTKKRQAEAEQQATLARRAARRPQLQADLRRRRLNLMFPGTMRAARGVRTEARRLYRHPYRRTAAAVGGAAQFAAAGVGGLGSMAGNALSSIFRVDSMVGLAATLTGVTLTLWGIKKAADAVGSAFHTIVSNGMEMERTRITFEVLLGNVEKGRQMFAQIQDLAIISPYTTKQLQNSAQMMLGMGVSAKNIIPSLSRIGDIATGDSDRFRHLAYAFSQVMAEGKLSGLRMRQFATAGIGVGDFAKTMGVSPGMFRALLRENMVSSNVMIETFNNLTSEGGRFFNMSQRGLETVSGQWERLSDVVEQTAGKMGEAFFKNAGVAKGIGSVTDFLFDMQDSMVGLAGKGGTVFAGIGQEIRPFLEGIGSGSMQFMENWGPSLKTLLPTLGEVREGARGVLDVFLNIADVIGKITANIGSMLGTMIMEGTKFYLAFSHSPLGKQMGMEPVPVDTARQILLDLKPRVAALHAMPLMHQSGMRDIRREVNAARLQQDARERFIGPIKPSDAEIEAMKARSMRRIGLGDEFFPEGTSIVQQVLGQVGAGVPGQVGHSLGTGVTALEGFRNRRMGILQQIMGGAALEDRMPIIQAGQLLTKTVPAYGRNFLGEAFADAASITGFGFHGRDVAGGVGEAISKILGPALQIGGAFMPMGALADPRKLQIADYNSYMKFRGEMGGLLDPASRLTQAAGYGTSEAVDAINKAQLNTASVEEEVLRTLAVANELHRSTNTYMAAVEKILGRIDANKIIVKEENP